MNLKINKILFITLSSIGDVMLTLPALDYLRENFPESKITVMVGPRAKEIFEDNSYIDRLVIYDKYSRLRQKFRLFNEFKKENFDLVVDFRNTLYGALLPAKFRTSPFLYLPANMEHMYLRNLYRLGRALKIKGIPYVKKRGMFFISRKDKDYVDALLAENGIRRNDKIILVNPHAASDTRKWSSDKFTQLCDALGRQYKVILIGAKVDRKAAQQIYAKTSSKIFDFTGLTSIKQLGFLLERSSLLISGDTGTLHLGSYLNRPIVSLFGPGREKKYGPWSDNYAVVKKDIFCRPCQKAQCRYGTLDCMKLIKTADVLRQIKNMLISGSGKREAGYGIRYPQPATRYPIFRRILIVRTDRIGDVILSTPVIKALRDTYPSAYIAMMVGPYAKEIVEGNPYLDDVIIYDKDNKHKSWQRSFKFAQNLKKKKFDLAIVLHPTNRAHLITFFAGIPKRIGYNRKLGFLLTDQIKHTKQRGEKHELEYNLDLLHYLGIEPQDKNLFLPIKPESEIWAQDLLKHEGIQEADRLLAIHPAASCKSKIWPVERFSEAAEKLMEKYSFKALLIAGPKDIALANDVAKNMHSPMINLAGKTSVSQLASVLKRCSLFISNDSGPVHIASAVGTPVISIFGRNQAGLSPKRWGPLGLKDRIIHKEVGCIECLAHNCTKEFACLRAITVDDVVNAADSILKS